MTFEEEMKALGEWIKQRTDEYIEALNREREHLQGLDSPLDEVRKQDDKEFNRRLLELKKKYSVE
jgi:hypothetical protein